MTSRFRFISTHRATWSVKRLCRILAVSRSGFYRWAASEPARQERAAAEDTLAGQIRIIHVDSGGTYGSPRVTVKLRDQRVRVNRKRVERIMRHREVVGRHLRRRKRTTIPDPATPPVPDPIGRDFTATARDQRWCGDITYLRVGGGWLYLATVIDIATRRLIGWSINTHMRTSLVIDALDAAVAARGGPGRRRDLPLGQGRPVQQQRLHRCMRPSRHPPLDGADRLVVRQRAGRGVLRHPQTRVGRRPPPLGIRSRRPPRRVPVDRVLQPPSSALRTRLPQPLRLRTDPHTHYAASGRGMTRCLHPGGETSDHLNNQDQPLT